MEEQFFINGGFVSFCMMDKFLQPKNRHKTVAEIFKENNLDRLDSVEAYILNPTFVISTLYSTFLIYQQKLMENENELLGIFEEKFVIIKNIKKNNLVRSIRNSIAHFNINFVRENGINVMVFCDKYPKETDFHFEARISYENLLLLIKDLQSKL